MKMGRNKKACAACKYHRKKCSPECPLAPYFPSDTGGEDFHHVVKVFGASNFTKLLLKSSGAEQRSAAETMIMEARARRSDPVHGLGGVAMTLSKKLNHLACELAFVNQQNQFHRYHSGVMQQEHQQVESNEASSPSPLRAAVPFSSLQECGTSSHTQNDEFSPFIPTALVDYDAIKRFGSSKSAYTYPGDIAMAKVKHHNKESGGLVENFNHFHRGVVFKQLKDAEGLTKTSVQEYKGIVQNYEDYVNLSQENKNNVKCSMDVEEPDLRNCLYYNECTANLNQDGEEAAEKYSFHLPRAPPKSPFAPLSPLDKKREDFQNVVKFTKLIKSAEPHQRLVSETMIMEASDRKSDPVHGLAGIAKTLSQKLNDPTPELAFNQENRFHCRHSIVMQQEPLQFQSNEAKGGCSTQLRTAVQSHSLQDTGSGVTQNDEFSPYFLTSQDDYNATKPFGSSLSAYTNVGDTDMGQMKHRNKEYDGWKENSLAEARQNAKASTDQQQLKQHHPHPQQHQQHPRRQQHPHYPQQSQLHHQYPQQFCKHSKKPQLRLQRQHRRVAVHRENASVLGAVAANMKNANRTFHGPHRQRRIGLWNMRNVEFDDAKGTTYLAIGYDGGVIVAADGCAYLPRTPRNVAQYAAIDILPSDNYYENLETELEGEGILNDSNKLDMQREIQIRATQVKSSDVRDKNFTLNDPGNEIIGVGSGHNSVFNQVMTELYMMEPEATIDGCIDACKKIYKKKKNKGREARFYFASYEQGKLRIVHVSRSGVRDIHGFEVQGAGAVFGQKVLSEGYKDNLTKERALELARKGLRASSVGRCSGGKLRFTSLDMTNCSDDEPWHLLWPVLEDDRELEDEFLELENEMEDLEL